MTKTEKAKIARLTRDDIEHVVRDLCIASIKLDEQQAQLNDALARAREHDEPEIAALQARHKELFAFARAWADAHPEQFAGKRSVALVHGTMLYRRGKPSLKTLTGVTWDKVIAMLKTLSPTYVRVKEEVDKAAIIEDRASIGAENLQTLGLRIDQAERFDVDLNKDSVQPKKEIA